MFSVQVVGLEFDRKDIEMNKLVTTTLESKFHVYDMRIQHPVRGFASLSESVRYRSMLSFFGYSRRLMC